eukprot:CAMPEP_0180367312 /NCGR_PEP_ID=MMETSP0989-20121125/16740_1 /TAXON_ID=697907 /ORGANISM="non described non described, Strain CCMP2293" /LENGTH=316 /DNA_ID=CAMNT_0022361303 /DNA_START=71 /DNA_END=1022 /DNA_ORIENTATION=-
MYPELPPFILGFRGHQITCEDRVLTTARYRRREGEVSFWGSTSPRPSISYPSSASFSMRVMYADGFSLKDGGAVPRSHHQAAYAEPDNDHDDGDDQLSRPPVLHLVQHLSDASALKVSSDRQAPRYPLRGRALPPQPELDLHTSRAPANERVQGRLTLRRRVGRRGVARRRRRAHVVGPAHVPDDQRPVYPRLLLPAVPAPADDDRRISGALQVPPPVELCGTDAALEGVGRAVAVHRKNLVRSPLFHVAWWNEQPVHPDCTPHASLVSPLSSAIAFATSASLALALPQSNAAAASQNPRSSPEERILPVSLHVLR